MGERGRGTRHKTPGRLYPPEYLETELIVFWDRVVDSVRPGHFVESDVFILTVYCRALYANQKYFALLKKHGPVDHEEKVSVYSKLFNFSQKSVSDLSSKLRLAPVNRSQISQTSGKAPAILDETDREGLL